MAPRDEQDRINQRVYQAPRVHRKYRDKALDASEQWALSVHGHRIRHRDVLEMGVGTGRITRHLVPLARAYVGIDYSPTMVERARRELPGVDIRLMDMRDLGELAPDSFDCVFALCNLLDAVSHEDRHAVLDMIHRLLRPGGVLMFSSHNRRYRHAGAPPRLEWAANPFVLARRAARHVVRVLNHRRMRPHRREEASYALFDDAGHHHALLHYYVARPVQSRHLEALGFSLLGAAGRDGRPLEADDDDSGTPDILYVARREGGTQVAGEPRAR